MRKNECRIFDEVREHLPEELCEKYNKALENLQDELYAIQASLSDVNSLSEGITYLDGLIRDLDYFI